MKQQFSYIDREFLNGEIYYWHANPKINSK